MAFVEFYISSSRATTSSSPNSPSQILQLSAFTGRNPICRTLNLPLSPRPVVGSLKCSLYEEPSSRFHQRFKLSCRNGGLEDSSELHYGSVSKDSVDNGFDSKKNDGISGTNPNSRPSVVDKSIHGAVWIGVATVASKSLGLLREVTLAAVFGVGPVATAFKYASVLPGFFGSLLGGVNGPLHITMATTLSKLPEESGKKLIQNALAVMFLIGGVLGALSFMYAESIIYVLAPGLWILTEGQITREIAIGQLKLMIPCIMFAGPVGLGFGCLSAGGDDILACISPALSSISIISLCITYVLIRRSNAFSPEDALFGGMLIAFGASIGSFSQWLIQVIMHERMRCHPLLISWLDIIKDKDVHEFFMLMLPATLVSGMAQIASFTDLYFASYIPGAAAGLSYAHLLAMAPLGILSSITVLPLVSTFSRLTKPSSWVFLEESLKQAILQCMVIVLPVTLTLCLLAEPLISVLFQRFTFGSAASSLVSSSLICYSLGSPFYIIREVLVMVFYALGDGERPFMISMFAILLNGFLDWLFASRLFLGAQGLALATSFATALSVLLLLHFLGKKLTGLTDFKGLVGPLLQLLTCCIISGISTSASYTTLRHLLSSFAILRHFKLMEFLSITVSGCLGLCGFYFPLAFLRIPVTNPASELLKAMINRWLRI